MAPCGGTRPNRALTASPTQIAAAPEEREKRVAVGMQEDNRAPHRLEARLACEAEAHAMSWTTALSFVLGRLLLPPHLFFFSCKLPFTPSRLSAHQIRIHIVLVTRKRGAGTSSPVAVMGSSPFSSLGRPWLALTPLGAYDVAVWLAWWGSFPPPNHIPAPPPISSPHLDRFVPAALQSTHGASQSADAAALFVSLNPPRHTVEDRGGGLPASFLGA